MAVNLHFTQIVDLMYCTEMAFQCTHTFQAQVVNDCWSQEIEPRLGALNKSLAGSYQVQEIFEAFQLIQAQIASISTAHKFEKKDIAWLNRFELEIALFANEIISPPVLLKSPSFGLQNILGNDCWINAAVQLLRSSATLQSKCPTFTYSYELRAKIPGCSEGQADSAECLAEFLPTFSFVQYQDSIKDASAFPERFVSFELVEAPEAKFHDLFSSYFSTTFIGTDQVVHEKKIKFKTAPLDLPIQFKRFTYGDTYDQHLKIHTPIAEIPGSFTLESKYTEDAIEATYELTAAIIHIGENANSGHNIALRKVGKKWYLCNDAEVLHLQDEMVQILLKQAYIINFVRSDKSAVDQCLEMLVSQVEIHEEKLELHEKRIEPHVLVVHCPEDGYTMRREQEFLRFPLIPSKQNFPDIFKQFFTPGIKAYTLASAPPALHIEFVHVAGSAICEIPKTLLVTANMTEDKSERSYQFIFAILKENKSLELKKDSWFLDEKHVTAEVAKTALETALLVNYRSVF